MARKPLYSLKVIRERYQEGLEKGMLRALYEAYSEFNRVAYDLIIFEAPISKHPNPRWPAGFVKSHIKLVTKRRPPYSYQEVDVPGKYSKGSRAWRAWVVIQTLHEGWTHLPFERKPTRKSVLSFPVRPGARVLRPGEVSDRVFVKKAIQAKQITLNPWISNVWPRVEPLFSGMLTRAMDRQRKKREITSGELKK